MLKRKELNLQFQGFAHVRNKLKIMPILIMLMGGCCGRDCAVVGFTTNCAISAHRTPFLARCTQYNIM